MNTLFQYILTPMGFLMNAFVAFVESEALSGMISLIIGVMVIFYWYIKIKRQQGKHREECKQRELQAVEQYKQSQDENK